MFSFDVLNEKQIEAVKETEGFVRVIAGAGSGKTKLLVSRYAYLVQELGIDPANILCVTFTNKAAGEMKRRVRALIGPEFDTALICTYHGFCARLLREDPEKLFFSKGFQIIDVPQQKAILEDIYQKHELKLDRASFESFLKKIAKIKSNLDYVPRFCSPKPCQILDDVNSPDNEIIEEFLQHQKATYSLDFSDLMSLALYLLETDEEIRTKWQEKLNYIQVDEFQDSSTRELRLVDILSGKYQNLMIVGDPDQNIYEWRGSDVKLLVDFDKTHIPTKTVILSQNYRSTPEILNCANDLIEKNLLRLKKDLFTLIPNGTPVIHYHSKTEEEEGRHLVAEIRALMKKYDLSYSDFAVLYRSGFLSRLIEKKLVESNIPYEIYGGVKFYQRMEIQDAIAYLKLIAYDDDMAFKRIINSPRRKFGRTKMSKLISISESTGQSLFASLKANLLDSAFSSSGASAFVAFIEKVRKGLSSMRIAETVNMVMMESGYEQYIRELGDEERLENISEFKRIANEFERGFGENLSLKEFLQQIALQSNEDEDKPADAVKLMTIHAAKGLEFPVVFIFGFTEGIFPSSKTIEERKALGLEEERRLCYVAITRAKERLFLMDSEGFSDAGIRKLPSRFLQEIGIQNYLRIGKISKSLQESAASYITKNSPRPIVESAALIPEEIDHHIFGHGKILKITNQGNYLVQFDGLSQPRNISRDYLSRDHRIEIVNEKPASVSLQSEPIVPLPEPKNEQPEDEEEVIEAEVVDEDEVIGEETEGELEQAEFIEEIEESSLIIEESTPEDESQPDEAIEETRGSGLWNDPNVPKTGWVCEDVSDYGPNSSFLCQMCLSRRIRYVHHMVHPEYPRQLNVGCVCAGNMEGDMEAAKARERAFKNKQTRRENFHTRKWRRSAKGASFINIDGHHVVLCQSKFNGRWKYVLDGTFSQTSYPTRSEAVDAAFEALDALTHGK